MPKHIENLKEVVKNYEKEVHELRVKVVSQTTTLLTAAFAFMAAFAWNNAVQAVFNKYYPPGEGLFTKFIYAIILTLILVIISIWLTRISKKLAKKRL